MQEKTEMTIENVQNLWQTIANILAEKYEVSIEVNVKRKEK